MKKVLFIGMLVGCIGNVQGQGFFKQNKTYLKRTGEQIALLQVYIEALKKGYKIAEDGLNLINDIKHGDFSIHNGYFNSLSNINPSIKNYSKVDDITKLYEQIAALYHQTTKTAKDAVFSAADREAVETIFSSLLQKANDNLQQVKTLTTSGNYALKDDERLERIETLYADMRDKYAFAKDFSNSIAKLLVQKRKEHADVNGTEKMLQLKP